MSTHNREAIAEQIVLSEINNLRSDPSIVKENGCAACHILFTLSNRMQISEQDASDLLSEALFNNPEINELFIEIVENIHMKQRMMGVSFSIKRREAKDKYIDSNFKNALAELSGDIANYGADIVLRKLLISSISLEIAKNIGIDHHAAIEELYYYMRKNDQQTDESILEFANRFYEKIRRRK
jgi:hypothetical protein